MHGEETGKLNKHFIIVGEINPGYLEEANSFKLLKTGWPRRLHQAGCIVPVGSGRLGLPRHVRPAGLKPDQPTDSSVPVGQPRVTARTSCRAFPVHNHDNGLKPDQRVDDIIGITL